MTYSQRGASVKTTKGWSCYSRQIKRRQTEMLAWEVRGWNTSFSQVTHFCSFLTTVYCAIRNSQLLCWGWVWIRKERFLESCGVTRQKGNKKDAESWTKDERERIGEARKINRRLGEGQGRIAANTHTHKQMKVSLSPPLAVPLLKRETYCTDNFSFKTRRDITVAAGCNMAALDETWVLSLICF